jgi:two-component system, chemotaxis family, protein-glutamate methylesterase/glutaminase
MTLQNGSTFAVIVIGGSAGAFEPLKRIVGGLPDNLPAAVFVTTHTSPDSISAVPHILARAGSLFATHALDRAPIAPGRIIVAPPDFHLALQDRVMRVTKGPKENGSRPSIDVLFRSAAEHFGPAVCGVLLSGTLDDGVAGLREIRENGGLAIVQDPEEALFGDMPYNALKAKAADVVHPSPEIAPAITAFAHRIVDLNVQHKARTTSDPRVDGTPSVFTCPDCGGTLWETDEEGFLRFRCRTGHSYNSNSMLAVQRDSVEQSLWSAIRVLEERADLLRRIGRRARLRGDQRMADRLLRQEEQTRNDQAQLHKALTDLLSQPWLPEAYSNKRETLSADVGE